MPELPDVEATRRYLVSQGLVGVTITEAELLWSRAVREPSDREFKSWVAGCRVEEVRRRAKYLILGLKGRSPCSLLLHLRMTGSLQIQKAEDKRPRYTRNILYLDDGRELRFVDPRKLGAMWLVEDEDEVLSGLGPEPLDPEFTPQALGDQLSPRNAPVKALLCDQSVVAGIGNIYADEVLFLARVHPLKLGRELSEQDIEALHQAIVTRLREATEILAPLAAGGSPPTEGREGLKHLLVPRSEGPPCGGCRESIRRTVVRGRSTYFCPRCQSL